MTADRLDLDALEALIDAGSKGTWWLDGTWWLEGVDYRVVASENNAEIAFSDDDDGALIVALRNAAPALIAAARERDAAQAALARVTDERLLERMRHDLELAGRWDAGYADVEAGLDTILATIRAVAGEGQEAGGK